MRLTLIATLALPTLGLTQNTTLPAPPTWATSSMLSNLRHGLQLLSRGDFEFAVGHFEGALPPTPTRVYINESGTPKAQRDQCGRSAREALAAWNEALPELVEFVEVDEEDEAHVVIQFEYDVASRREGEVKLVCGVTRPKATHWGKKIKRSAVVRVAVFPHGVGRHVHKPESLAHVTGHELGHFLGLGESDDIGDIMGPDSHKGSPSLEPSDGDIGRLEAIVYIAEALLAVAQKGKSVPVPEEWTNAKPAGQHSTRDPHAE